MPEDTDGGFEKTTTATTDPVGEPAATIEPTDNLEVLRALEYGWVPDDLKSDWDAPIQFSEFCGLLQNIITDIDASKLSEWNSFSLMAKHSQKEMLIGDAMAPAYYAASLLGYGSEPQGDWLRLSDYGSSTDWSWDGVISVWELLPRSANPSPFKDHSDDAEPAGCDYNTAGYFWCRAQYSRVDGEPVLRADDATLKTALTREGGIALAARLYESMLPVAETETCSEALEILANADAWKTSFFNNARETQYTGTAQALLKYTDLMGDSDQAANARPVFSGNTYAQYENGWLAEWNGDLKPITEAVIRDILGDTTGTVVVVN